MNVVSVALVSLSLLAAGVFAQLQEDDRSTVPAIARTVANPAYASREDVLVFNVGPPSETGGDWRARGTATRGGSRFSFDPGPGASVNPIVISGIGLAFFQDSTGLPQDSTFDIRVSWYLDPVGGPPVDPTALPAAADAVLTGTLQDFVTPGYIAFHTGASFRLSQPVALGSTTKLTSGFVVIEALATGTTNPSPSVGPIFRGHVSPSAGSSDGVRWADANNNGVFEASEAFGGPTNRRIVYMNLGMGMECVPPTTSSSPSPRTVCVGTDVTLTASFSGSLPVEVQWRLDGAPIAGANRSIVTLSAVTRSDAGWYDCVATNECGSVTTAPALLTVLSPQIVTTPSDQTVNVDQPVTFVVETDLDSPCAGALAFQWQRRNPLVADETAADAWLTLRDGGGVLGAQSPTLVIMRPTPGFATGFRCRLTGGCGCEFLGRTTVHTNTVNFSVPCPADFNADGGIDFGDIESFFERWENGC